MKQPFQLTYLCMVQDDKEYKDYYKALVDVKKGTPMHLLLGHGATQESFENRDIGTVNDCVYEKLEKTQQFIDPHHNISGVDGKTLNKF